MVPSLLSVFILYLWGASLPSIAFHFMRSTFLGGLIRVSIPVVSRHYRILELLALI